jgi:hypothetical protein
MKKGFNLLKQQAEPPSVWTKIYDWVVGSARIIIIGVEALVIIAFGIRIYVDFQAKELDKEVEVAERIMSNMGSNELKFRNIQLRTASYETIWTNSINYLPLLQHINDLLPSNAQIEDLTIVITKDAITIEGKAPKTQENIIKEYENNLKTRSTFLEAVTLERLEDNVDELKFTFRANLINLTKKTLYGSSGD